MRTKKPIPIGKHQPINTLGRRFTSCDCGYGPGFYHTGKDTTHEYNPFATVEQATATYHKDRQPLAEFFGHISGHYVQLCLHQEGAISKTDKVWYAEAGSREAAFRIAAQKLLKDPDQLVLL